MLSIQPCLPASRPGPLISTIAPISFFISKSLRFATKLERPAAPQQPWGACHGAKLFSRLAVPPRSKNGGHDKRHSRFGNFLRLSLGRTLHTGSKSAINPVSMSLDQSFSLAPSMTNEKDKQLPPEFSQSERFSQGWTFRLIDPPAEAGKTGHAPAILRGDLAREFADLHMVANDLSFALECLKEANKIGLPDSDNLLSKALIFSAVITYARPFIGGIRKMDITYFSSIPTFKAAVHKYLISLRNKHVGHSVNEFERSEATGVMVGTVDTPLAELRPAGVGVLQAYNIGLTRKIVEHAIDKITDMIRSILADIDKKRPELFQEFSAKFAIDGKWEMMPFQLPNRENVAKKRK
jgi:hypothetical protein